MEDLLNPATPDVAQWAGPLGQEPWMPPASTGAFRYVRPPELRSRLADAVAAGADAVRVLAAPPYPTAGGPARATVLSAATSRHVPVWIVQAEPTAREGVPADPPVWPEPQVRVLADVPVNLIVAGGQVAWVANAPTTGDATSHLVEVRWPALVAMLSGLFDSCWDRALPLPRLDDWGAPVSRTDRDVLHLLAAGLSDKDAASRLGVSVRTLRRWLNRLLSVTGSASRYQLGVRAVELGWIRATEPETHRAHAG